MGIKVAVIDNGVDRSALHTFLKKEMVIQDGKICLEKDLKPEFSHGTNCALIIEKYCPDVELSSVRILDGKGKGLVADLKPALEWCFENEYYLVNLSFGTTHFKDRKQLRAMVDCYSDKGMVIVAASANNGYVSYPASFDNVIGVAAGEKFGLDAEMRVMKGIDFVAPSDHEVVVDGIAVSMGKSNSYAAPYVTAMVANFILEYGSCGLATLKKKMDKILESGAESRKQSDTQILHWKKREKDISIPIVICRMDETQEFFWWLCKLRDCFEAEGYNAYTVSSREAYARYGLEYLPDLDRDPMEQEKLNDFLYWKTFYQQSDLILAAVGTEYVMPKAPDIELDIRGTETGCLIKLVCDGRTEKEEKLMTVDENVIEYFYQIIVRLLTEETDEQ